ncbi:MAG: hypothetical protein K0S67_47 [Nitrososphaeraceae archaeon]|jgi:flagellar biosynthesis/type III secretory pathway chaperone|nr:hypothetical protein [Nitrososphaeraceae archaeon]
MPKTNPKGTGLSKYEKTTKILDIIKKCKLMNLNNKAIIDSIMYHTGREVTEAQLGELVEMAKREVREQQIEVDKHMEHMVKIGLYTDTMNNHEQLDTVQNIIYSMILEESVLKGEQKNKNMILAMSNTLKNIIAAKDGLVTNIGFLAKIKNVYENTQNIDLDNPTPTAAVELNKPTSIMIKDQKTDVNKLIDQALDKKELESGRVA